jgi:pyruvate-formate lyase-activating enzyme
MDAGAPGRSPLPIEIEPRYCLSHAADLTAGCSFACIYCPFAELNARRRGVRRPTPVDLGALDGQPAPPSLFLSPASDAFAPQAAAGTHRLLGALLPRGTVVGIVTKGVIPDETIALLAEHRERVEGVAVGVTSLDEERNRRLEPGCPPAALRLRNVDRLAGAGVAVGVRLDPLIPALDDAPEALERVVDEAARRAALGVTASYVVAWGHALRRMRREPLLAAAVSSLTERVRVEGGLAWGVPLARRLETYARLATLARARGLRFNVCGCKNVELQTSSELSTSCRNTWFLAERGLPGARP